LIDGFNALNILSCGAVVLVIHSATLSVIGSTTLSYTLVHILVTHHTTLPIAHCFGWLRVCPVSSAFTTFFAFTLLFISCVA
jgi:hypothetical protein